MPNHLFKTRLCFISKKKGFVLIPFSKKTPLIWDSPHIWAKPNTPTNQRHFLPLKNNKSFQVQSFQDIPRFFPYLNMWWVIWTRFLHSLQGNLPMQKQHEFNLSIELTCVGLSSQNLRDMFLKTWGFQHQRTITQCFLLISNLASKDDDMKLRSVNKKHPGGCSTAIDCAMRSWTGRATFWPQMNWWHLSTLSTAPCHILLFV